jgi:hypothetical protein
MPGRSTRQALDAVDGRVSAVRLLELAWNNVDLDATSRCWVLKDRAGLPGVEEPADAGSIAAPGRESA